MLARLLFAAVALCLIGALPDARAARASQRVVEPGLAADRAAIGLAARRLDAGGAARGPDARPAQGR